MKKTLSLLLILTLALMLIFSLASCGETPNPDEEGEDEGEFAPYDPTNVLDYKLSQDGDYYIVTDYGYHTNSKVEIPAEHEGKPVKAIARSAFSQSSFSRDNLKEIIIPASITSIDDYAFANCTLLEKVTFKGELTSLVLGEAVFRSCDALTSITLPEGLVEIGDYAFDMCSNLEPVTIPSSVRKIGIDAFRSCGKITGSKATSFNGVYTLPTPNGVWVLKADRGLVDANLPDNAVGIAGGAFKSCSSLVSVEIPKNVAYIGENAFGGATALTTVNYSNKMLVWYDIIIEEDNFPLLNATINCIE